MQKAARLSKIAAVGFLLGLMMIAAGPRAFSAGEIKKNETGFYRDVFDQNLYYEGTHFLHLDRLARAVTGKKVRALDVNVYDEVPDSGFFTNRHGREKMSAEELGKGCLENSGPDLSAFTVTEGKFDGLHPRFMIKDSRGDAYELKFDGEDGFELATGAEIVASRFLYALGYNVPQYTLGFFAAAQAKLDSAATIVDDSGFRKKFTQERLEKYLMFIPQDDQGRYRTSARKIPAGEPKGYFSFQGRRKDDPEDKINHEEMRSLRALRVFAAWINAYEIRESNTLDILTTENAKRVLKHYLFDFSDAFGSSAAGAKPPMFTREHLIDFGEAAKAFLSLGFWEKPWQKQWRESGQKTGAQALGYFNNRSFRTEKYKTLLPAYAFKDLSRADGFWAAKTMLSFTDEDIKALVKSGQFSHAGDADTLAAVLIERRNLIVQYWFSKSGPLDDFEYQSGRLTFKDAAVNAQMEPKDSTAYAVDIYAPGSNKSKPLGSFESKEPSLDLSRWSSSPALDAVIRTSRKSTGKFPYVRVKIRDAHIAGIIHED